MRFYLASWIGDGSEENPYRPSVGDGVWAALDLRPDATRQEGRVLVAAPAPLASVPRGVLDLGELAEKIPRGISRKLENDLGLTLDQTDTLQAIVAELLILHGDNRPRGSRTRWRPLKADHRGRHKIVMLGETLYDAPAIVGVTATDDFNRANSATLGGNWVEAFDNTHWEIVTNAAELTSGTNARSTARLDVALSGDDHYAEFTILTAGDATDAEEANPLTRFHASANTFYMGQCNLSDDSTAIFKRVSGSFTSLGTGTHTFANNDVVRLESDGSTQRLLINSTEIQSLTDTSITGNVRTGMHGRRSVSANVRIDDFEAADLGAATELTGTVSASIDIARATAEEVEQLDGQSDASLDVVGSLSQTQELSGAVQSAVQATGALTQTNELNGTVSTSIEATGSLTETEAVRGQSDVSIDATGAITQTQELTGTVQASISATGSLTETEQLNGAVQSSIDATGAITQTHELAGQADVSISASGQLTQEGQNELTGTVSVSVSATGALTQTQELAGQSDASISDTANITVTGVNELAGTVSASIEATGATEQTQELSGTADASISTSGALTIEALSDLQASLALAVGVTGQLTNTHELRQTLTQSLVVVGALKQLQEATARSRSQIQVSGALTVTQPTSKGSNGVTDALVGSLSMTESLVGSAGVSDASAGNVGASDG